MLKGCAMADTEPLLRIAFPKVRIDTIKRLSLRYRSKVKKTDGCWIWSGSISSTGYGTLSVGKGPCVNATHIALALDGRPRPGKAWALHSCDNPPCVNPAHLRWGTPQQNVDDREERQRSVRLKGEKHGQAKLTDADVRYIRSCGKSLKDLSEIFGMSIGPLSMARSGKTWGHVR